MLLVGSVQKLLFVAFFLLVLYGSFAWVLNCKPSTFSRFGSYRIGRSTVCSQGGSRFTAVSRARISRITMLEFFNRDEEVKYLTETFQDLPYFTILIGPPSTGKTLLTRHVLERKFSNGTKMFHSIFLNLSGMQIKSRDSLILALESAVETASAQDPSLQRFLKAIQSIKVDYRQGDIMTGFGVGELKLREPAPSDSKYFKRLVQAIPKAGDGDFPSVLVVDEANTLKDLAYQESRQHSKRRNSCSSFTFTSFHADV